MKKNAFLLLWVIPFLLIGCQQQEETLIEEGNQQQPLKVKNSIPMERKDYSNQEIAKHLANLASRVPNVNSAYAVIAGPYAVVGIDVDKDLDRSRVGTIKFSVAEALHHDPYGKSAIVVADADATERIKEMGNKIQQGHPVQGIVDELAGIVGRYMPELPLNEDQLIEGDENKGSISEKEKNQLNEIQNDQSNHRKEKNN